MRRRVSASVSIIVLAGVITTVLCAQGTAPDAPKKSARKAKPPNKALIEGPPLSVDGLISMNKAPKAIVTQEVITTAIRNRKLSFTATEENLTRLRSGGLNDQLLAVIREVAPAAPPTPVAPKTGALVVSCNPKECNVLIDSSTAATQNGTLRRTLPVGKHNVEVSRAGFTTEKRAVEVTADGARLDITLKADAAARTRMGYALFDKMVQAIGDENADVKATGSLRVDRGSSQQELTFRMQSAGPVFQAAISRGNQAYELMCNGESCNSQKPKLFTKMKELKDGKEFENDLRSFRRYSLTRLIADLKAKRANTLQATSDSELPATDGHFTVRLEGVGETYDLTLSAAYLPLMISYTSKLGGQPLQATFNDYKDLGKVRYPKMTQIHTNTANAGLIQVRLDEFPPSLK